jgi:hypothetical protein
MGRFKYIFFNKDLIHIKLLMELVIIYKHKYNNYLTLI